MSPYLTQRGRYNFQMQSAKSNNLTVEFAVSRHKRWGAGCRHFRLQKKRLKIRSWDVDPMLTVLDWVCLGLSVKRLQQGERC